MRSHKTSSRVNKPCLSPCSAPCWKPVLACFYLRWCLSYRSECYVLWERNEVGHKNTFEQNACLLPLTKWVFPFLKHLKCQSSFRELVLLHGAVCSCKRSAVSAFDMYLWWHSARHTLKARNIVQYTKNMKPIKYTEGTVIVLSRAFRTPLLVRWVFANLN